MIGLGAVAIGVVILLAQNRPILTRSRAAGESRAGVASGGPSLRAALPSDASAAILVDSDWDRFRLRLQSEYLRAIRPGDHAALLRLTSRTLRGALQEIGITREHIEERPSAAAATGAGKAPVQWRIQVPPRASLYRINDAVTQAMLVLGGRSIRGRERAAQTLGTALDLRVGYGSRATHAIVVEPNAAVTDADAKIAFVVLDATKSPKAVYRSFLASPIPFTFAIRSDQPGASRLAKEVRDAKQQVFLHLSLEPRGYPRIDPGKDAILLDLSQVEIEDRIARGLSTVGSARGVITRLGGAAVNDADVMRAVLGELKRRDIPFVDAHGSGPSVVEEIGEEVGARTAAVGGTLDDSGNTAASVRARLRQLVQAAVQRGGLVVTLRPSPLYIQVIESEQANLRAQGIDVVPAAEIVL